MKPSTVGQKGSGGGEQATCRVRGFTKPSLVSLIFRATSRGKEDERGNFHHRAKRRTRKICRERKRLTEREGGRCIGTEDATEWRLRNGARLTAIKYKKGQVRLGSDLLLGLPNWLKT